MEFPSLLLVLLVLPVVAAAVILAVSVGRRRSHTSTAEPAAEPVHRLQSDTAAEQDAVVHPAAPAPRASSARMRRAASADRQREG